MNQTKFKRLPYGTSDFRSMRTENYAYVDKTRFIEMLELESNKSHFFIRPRKFGKSLFFSMLSYYYDINCAEQFDQLFGDLYIGQHPTPERNNYAILEFDFSGIDTTNEERFVISFSNKVQNAVYFFFNRYANIFKEAETFIRQIDEEKPGIRSLNKAFSAADVSNVKIFVIIDEYDHFANDLIAMGEARGKNFYKMMVAANGLVRDFYENLKIATKSSVVNRTFITGISPVMLDDLTSGYNIGENLTLKRKYNEMMGFTHEEVLALMENTGVDTSLINVDMELYYNGYLFHKNGQNRVYNPSMMLYFFNQILEEGEQPENIIDPNLKTDYGRLRRLTQNEHNRDVLIQIVKDGGIVSAILEKFSIDRLYDDRYFISLLFYMGLITIKEPYKGVVRLGTPNFSIQTIYWEYIMQLVQDHSPDMTIDVRTLSDSIYALAVDGNLNGFIDYVSKNAFSKLSDYDLQRFDEKYIQILLLAYLFMSRIYVPMSEYETVPGRADIFLQRNPNFPQIKYEWVLELKYCKTGASEAEITQKRLEGLKQLKQYVNSSRLKDRPNMRSALIVFVGKNNYEIVINSQ
jgi:hypothetical protein